MTNSPTSTQARPLAIADLDSYGREKLRELNRIIVSMRNELNSRADASRAADRTHADEARRRNGSDISWLETDRNGRTIFIDGGRGVGKTTLLLTALRAWALGLGDEHDAPPADRPHPVAPVQDVVLLSRPLDFDTLPPGLPLLSWLLQPWRSFLDKNDLWRSDDGLEADYWSLHESVIAGWAAQGSSGGTERLLALGNQAEKWFDVPTRVRQFIDRSIKAYGAEFAGSNRKLFVVSIDDLDLQVDRLSELAHGLRLLSHHQVVYVMTGERRHVSLVLKRHYRRLHGSTRASVLADRFELVESDDDIEDVEDVSEELADAVLEKVFPEVSVVRLEPLSLKRFFCTMVALTPEQQGLATGGVDVLGLLLSAVPPERAKSLREIMLRAASALPTDAGVVTRRQLQLAIDELRIRPDALSPASALRLLGLRDSGSIRIREDGGLDVRATGTLSSAPRYADTYRLTASSRLLVQRHPFDSRFDFDGVGDTDLTRGQAAALLLLDENAIASIPGLALRIRSPLRLECRGAGGRDAHDDASDDEDDDDDDDDRIDEADGYRLTDIPALRRTHWAPPLLLEELGLDQLARATDAWAKLGAAVGARRPIGTFLLRIWLAFNLELLCVLFGDPADTRHASLVDVIKLGLEPSTDIDDIAFLAKLRSLHPKPEKGYVGLLLKAAGIGAIEFENWLVRCLPLHSPWVTSMRGFAPVIRGILAFLPRERRQETVQAFRRELTLPLAVYRTNPQHAYFAEFELRAIDAWGKSAEVDDKVAEIDDEPADGGSAGAT